MKRLIKYTAAFLIAALLLPLAPVQAASLDTLGLQQFNVQGVSAAEKSGPITSSISSTDLVMELPVNENEYRLGPGDVISVNIIVGDSALSISNQFTVGADGKIFYPNLGEIYLAGLNIVAAKDRINQKISHSFKDKFTLSLMLTRPKKVKIYLTGMVKSPGPLAVYDSSRVSEVIAQAGGIASGGSNRYVYIKRMGVNGENKILKADLFAAYRGRDLSKDIRIQSGDVVEVPDANNELISNSLSDSDDKLLFEGKESFVYVYGEVGNRGRFEFVPGRRVSDYISYAGGPTGKALLDFVSLTRHQGGKSEKYRINVSDIIYNGNYEKDMEVSGGDVINVPGNFFYFSDFASFANTILLALTLYGSLVK